MDFSVFSEISPLQAVLVHSPGKEIDRMPPHLMDELLFDDLLYGDKARTEHQFFTDMFSALGVEVFDIQTLLAEALRHSETDRVGLIKVIAMYEGLSNNLENSMIEMGATELTEALIHGIPTPASKAAPDRLYDLAPLPNLLFSRDSQIVIGNRIVFSAMKYRVRKRESMLSRFVFTHHPKFKQNKILRDFSFSTLKRSGTKYGSLTLEGGDVFVLAGGVVVVGISERTTEQGAEQLAQSIRESEGEAFHTLIMVTMPANRAQMHLDTVFTQVSEDECLVYGPMICKGSAETLSAIKIDLRSKTIDYGHRYGNLLECLSSCGIDLKPIYCGGKTDYIQQAREQWTDGANSFAIKPGVIVVYDRNTFTIEELSQSGYTIVEKGDWTKTEGKMSYDFTDGKKYALVLPSTELTRARGGARCMTMPLVRGESVER